MKNTQKYENEIIEVIKENKIYSILDIFAFYKGCSRPTFYNNGLDKLDSIKNAIDDNKVITKQTLKSKWAESDNPTLQIALFKVICTDEERKSLSQQAVDHTTGGEKLNTFKIEVTNPKTAEKLNKWLNEND